MRFVWRSYWANERNFKISYNRKLPLWKFSFWGSASQLTEVDQTTKKKSITHQTPNFALLHDAKIFQLVIKEECRALAATVSEAINFSFFSSFQIQSGFSLRTFFFQQPELGVNNCLMKLASKYLQSSHET